MRADLLWLFYSQISSKVNKTENLSDIFFKLLVYKLYQTNKPIHKFWKNLH